MEEPHVGKKHPRSPLEDHIQEGSGAAIDESEVKRIKFTDDPSAAQCTTTTSEDKKGLLSLPDELLLEIVKSMYPEPLRPEDLNDDTQENKNDDLRHVALGCHRLRNIAQEVLYTVCKVEKANLICLARTVLQRPDLFRKTKALVYNDRKPSGNIHPYSGFTPEDISAWKEAALVDYEEPRTQREVSADLNRFQRSGSSWDLDWAAVALLFARSPELKTLYIMGHLRPGLYSFLFKVAHITHSGVQRLIQNKLEEVYVTNDSKSADLLMCFDSCTNLIKLTLDDESIWRNLKMQDHSSFLDRYPIQSLPKSLEHLCLGFNSWSSYTRGVLQICRLQSFINRLERFPSLKTLEINYSNSLPALLLAILGIVLHHGQVDLELMEIVLQLWSKLPVNIRINVFSGNIIHKSYCGHDLIDELAPLFRLDEKLVPFDAVLNFIENHEFFNPGDQCFVPFKPWFSSSYD
ncbi:hypothetical protein DM02DRAFT_631757 [Periconia macrospinosa]|uniref:F-box domain-containing protein n=1 Tax=Periconia macrospinosa TaxID=97972 RepID=A0A2V1DF21_9PLEO|nr:hypothetical protein DM02DRAFT_631757 [Periconia macrospinosa]